MLLVQTLQTQKGKTKKCLLARTYQLLYRFFERDAYADPSYFLPGHARLEQGAYRTYRRNRRKFFQLHESGLGLYFGQNQKEKNLYCDWICHTGFH